MIYRVDYLFAILLAGFIAGAVLGRRLRDIEATRVARAYYALTALRVIAGCVVFACLVVLAIPRWNTLNSGLGDFNNFLVGGLFGLALVRAKPAEFLTDASVYSALCLSIAFTFVTTGFVKAFYMEPMAAFFTQSGYSISFLKLIMTLEVLSGAAMLIPWAILPAVFALSVDMLGAVYTHMHNGDPINDSTGAIGMLIRLAAILGIWVLAGRTSASPGLLRRRLAGALVAALLCVSMAVAGGTIMRHRLTPSPTRADTR
jgi:hypothetical protein